jgi:glycosyltransferase involved in cell wall biosynthesis
MTMRTGKSLPGYFRRGLHRADRAVANSAEARQTLIEQHAVAGEKISVIHNALVFPPEAALVRNEGARAQFGASASTLVLLCVAMFRPEKNQRELVEIAAQFPAGLDWQLWLAGDGPARAACERLVAEKKLGDRIKFPGFHADPSALYAAADVAVHASWSEALSNFLIEAQARGLPAVAYEAQGIRECFLPGKTGWAIARDDRGAFVEAVARLAAQTPAQRAALAAEAKNFARTTFDPARQVQAYLDLFQTLGRTGQP